MRPRPLAVVAPLAWITVINLLPLAGVAWWGWSLSTILAAYWAETGVLAVLVVPLSILAPVPPGDDVTRVETERGLVAGMIVGAYAWAWLLLGLFIVIALPLLEAAPALLAGTPVTVAWPNLWSALGAAICLAAGQAWSLWRPAGRRGGALQYLAAVGARSLALVIIVLIGMFGFLYFGSTHGAIYILVIFKITVDLVSHLRRARAGTAGAGGA